MKLPQPSGKSRHLRDQQPSHSQLGSYRDPAASPFLNIIQSLSSGDSSELPEILRRTGDDVIGESGEQINQNIQNRPSGGYGLSLTERLLSGGYESVGQAELDSGLEAALAAARAGSFPSPIESEVPLGASVLRGGLPTGSGSGVPLRSSTSGPSLRADNPTSSFHRDLEGESQPGSITQPPRSSRDQESDRDDINIDTGAGEIQTQQGFERLLPRDEIQDIERGILPQEPLDNEGSSSQRRRVPRYSMTDDEDDRESFFSAGPSSPIDPLRPFQTDLAAWWESHAGIDLSESVPEDAERPLESGLSMHMPGAIIGENETQAEDARALAEARARLAGGLKRYVFAKRAEGLLSPQGARALGYACDVAIQNADRPLGIWADAKASMENRLWVQICAWFFHTVRKMAYSLPEAAQSIVLPIVKMSTSWVRNYLGFAMLRSCEIALAYYMATTNANQAQWLRQVGQGGLLLHELDKEQERVSRFVVDREIEAPAHFQAIQTYRATMAVLRQQLGFINNMFSAGIIDEIERKNMVDPVDRKTRALEATGPAHSWPHAQDVIAGLPILTGAPLEMLRWFMSIGTLKEFGGGEVVWSVADEQGQGSMGMAVVIRGLVKVCIELEDGTPQERYFGSGSILGLLSNVTSHRTTLLRSASAVAQVSQLAKGVLVFHLPNDFIMQLRQAAADGNLAAESVLLKLNHEATLQVLNELKESAMHQIARDWEVAAIDRERDLVAAAYRAAVEAGTAAEGGEEVAMEAATRNLLINSKEMWTHAHFFAQRVFASMRRRLHRATIAELQPYQRYHQSSHIVLLAGAVQYSSQRVGQPSRTRSGPEPTVSLAMGKKVLAPAVLPLCAHLHFGTSRAGQPRDLLSGHQGALLMVWPVVTTPERASSPMGLANLETIPPL